MIFQLGLQISYFLKEFPSKKKEYYENATRFLRKISQYEHLKLGYNSENVLTNSSTCCQSVYSMTVLGSVGPLVIHIMN